MINKLLPPLIKSILLQSEGWLVGNSITNIINNQQVSDYDIIIPNRELFQITCATMGSHLEGSFNFNSYGGLKFEIRVPEEEENVIIDIWCEELDHFIKTANKLDYLYNLKKNILLQKQD